MVGLNTLEHYDTIVIVIKCHVAVAQHYKPKTSSAYHCDCSDVL